MEDFDIGEKFHNYLLRLCECAFCGVVIPFDIFNTTKEAEPIMIWMWLTFGWYPSPACSLHMLARAIYWLREIRLTPQVRFSGLWYL